MDFIFHCADDRLYGYRKYSIVYNFKDKNIINNSRPTTSLN